MNRIKNIKTGEYMEVSLTQQEQDLRDAKEAQWLAEKPMRDWKDEMAATDHQYARPEDIARFMEDFYEANMSALASKPQAFKDLHALRKNKRLQKPTKEK